MKRTILTLLVSVILVFTAGCASVFTANSDKPLTERQASQLSAELWAAKLTEIEKTYGPMWDEKRLVYNDLTMPFDYKVFGEKPADGRSLYISMHGGGNTPAQVNTQQWNNQKRLYAPDEGVYFVPRAAVDDWNMWFRPHIDTLFSMAIQAAMVKYDVNPNKVYIMGYSAGGDGAYRMAPRMADRWAAAAMMAGHPGEASPLNLRNIGFTLWMGEHDAAYDRNILAVKFGERMDSLHRADPEGYVHETHIMKGKGHWMDRADTVAVGWMSQFVRNPYPDRVVWRQEETNQRTGFYYLSVSTDEAKGGMEVRVDRRENVFEILRNDYNTLYINLNDRMVDLDKPVTVLYEGRTIFRGRVPRRARHIAASIDDRADPEYIFYAQIKIKNGEAKAL